MCRFVLGLILYLFPLGSVSAQSQTIPWWPVQSIDTMKYSRDQSRDRMYDVTFEDVIDAQVSDIAATGATHVGIATPYDDEFLPILDKWVSSARNRKLNVWFRGNFSGWEQWFGYKPIDRTEHIRSLRSFITKNGELFEDGDIFSSCPECENGGPGDPRKDNDPEAFRQFIIDEYHACNESFIEIAKKVKCNYFSMNGDVARLIMDRETTALLDGVIVIDHYVATPKQLANDIHELASNTGGRIILGEFGVPIPDIHGKMNEDQQAEWLRQAFSELKKIPELIGVNYWINIGGSTALWSDNGVPKKAVEVIKQAYKSFQLASTVTDSIGRPVKDVTVSTERKSVLTGWNGTFSLPYTLEDSSITLRKKGYREISVPLPIAGNIHAFTMHPETKSILYLLLEIITGFFRK